MKADIKKQWIDALRSGKYNQAKGRLFLSGGYCCLGVLCDIVKDKVGGIWEHGVFITGSFRSSSQVTQPVQDYTKVYRGEPHIDIPGNHPIFTKYPILSMGKREYHLSSLNDAGVSFADIADLIEELVPVE